MSAVRGSGSWFFRMPLPGNDALALQGDEQNESRERGILAVSDEEVQLWRTSELGLTGWTGSHPRGSRSLPRS